MHRYDDPNFRFNYEKIMEMTETCKQWGKWGPDDLSLIHISEPTGPY